MIRQKGCIKKKKINKEYFFFLNADKYLSKKNKEEKNIKPIVAKLRSLLYTVEWSNKKLKCSFLYDPLANGQSTFFFWVDHKRQTRLNLPDIKTDFKQKQLEMLWKGR